MTNHRREIRSLAWLITVACAAFLLALRAKGYLK